MMICCLFFSSGQNQMNAGPQHHQHLHHHLHHYHHPPRFHHFPVAPGMPSEFGPVVSCHRFLFVCFVCLFICLIFFGRGGVWFSTTNILTSFIFLIESQVWIFYFLTNFGKFSQWEEFPLIHLFFNLTSIHKKHPEELNIYYIVGVTFKWYTCSSIKRYDEKSLMMKFWLNLM